MNVDLSRDGPEFGRADQLRMGDGDGMERSSQFPLPEFQKIDEHREARSKIVVLPDISLQEHRMIRHPVEYLGRRQPVTLHLADEILGCHANSLSGAENWRQASTQSEG